MENLFNIKKLEYKLKQNEIKSNNIIFYKYKLIYKFNKYEFTDIEFEFLQKENIEDNKIKTQLIFNTIIQSSKLYIYLKIILLYIFKNTGKITSMILNNYDVMNNKIIYEGKNNRIELEYILSEKKQIDFILENVDVTFLNKISIKRIIYQLDNLYIMPCEFLKEYLYCYSSIIINNEFYYFNKLIKYKDANNIHVNNIYYIKNNIHEFNYHIGNKISKLSSIVSFYQIKCIDFYKIDIFNDKNILNNISSNIELYTFDKLNIFKTYNLIKKNKYIFIESNKDNELYIPKILLNSGRFITRFNFSDIMIWLNRNNYYDKKKTFISKTNNETINEQIKKYEKISKNNSNIYKSIFDSNIKTYYCNLGFF